MSPFLLFSFTSAVLVGLGLFGLVAHDHLLRKILALNVMSTGVFLFLVAVAHRNHDEIADPVPHAMVLTGIVVAVSVTAFALALARRLHAATGSALLSKEDTE